MGFKTCFLLCIGIGLGIPPTYSQSCPVPVESDFQVTTLIPIAAAEEPFEIDVLNSNELIWITRHGKVNILNLTNNQSSLIHDLATASELDVGSGSRSTIGLIGVTADPGYETNNWIYLMYVPQSDVNIYRLSRFTRSANTLINEKTILEVHREPVVRDHSGGSLAFGPNGNLFFSFGDNTQPGQSSGYTPIDERGLDNDAQRSSGNTNDLRGKVNRIKPINFSDSQSPVPGVGSTYQIPNGNLKEKYSSLWTLPDLDKVRPEVYVMGCRNPFRITVDPLRGWLNWGEVGPDAVAVNVDRGPIGRDEWNLARSAGNYGWPYFVGENQAYVDYDFATSTSSAAFDVNAPRNTSVNNTGSQILPPPQIPAMWLTKTGELHTPDSMLQRSGGNTAMGGSFYDYFAHQAEAGKKIFPAYFHKKLIVAEWSGRWMKILSLSNEGKVTNTDPFLNNTLVQKMMDMKFGKNGILYILDWGVAYQPNNANAKILKVEYLGQEYDPALCGAVPISNISKFSSQPLLKKYYTIPKILRLDKSFTGISIRRIDGSLIWTGSPSKKTLERIIVIPNIKEQGIKIIQFHKIKANLYRF